MNNQLSLKNKIFYALPAFTLAVIGIPVYVYMPKFYTDAAGVNIAFVGAVLLGARIFDAFTDPGIGLLSDNTKGRFGRRRPWIAAGSVLTAASVLFLFNPPLSGNINTGIWFAAGIFLLFLFWTSVVVPYESLGPELTFDYNERTSLFSIRDGFLIAGTLAAAASPALIKGIAGLGNTPEDEARMFLIMSAVYAPLIIISCFAAVYFLKEKPQANGYKKTGFIKGHTYVLQNRPFLVLLAAYTVSAIGNNLPATLILFYVQYVLGSSMADIFLLVYFLTGIAFLPLWIKISASLGKKKAWLAAMAINTGAFSGVFFLSQGDAHIYGILVFLSGIGFGATLAIPSSMQADVIDYDELISGSRREGQYVGIWSLAKKLAAAFGVGIGLLILGTSGYEPNIEQSESVVFTLRVLYALVPCLCNAAGFLIALFYNLDGETYDNIRGEIESRKVK
jgi:GPH family glycoside/pentoside/hexuronide:cation symporter